VSNNRQTLARSQERARFTLALAGIVAAGAVVAGASGRLPSPPPLQPPAKAEAKPLPTVVLRNGDMGAGADVPAGWEQKWVGRGKITVARDTTVTKGTPASLRVASEGGDAQGMASQTVEAGAGRKFTVSGWVKTAGNVKVNVAVQPFSSEWKPIGFVQVKYAQNDSDWAEFTKEVVLPEGTARFNLGLLIEGDGKAWLTGVKLSGESVKNEGVDPATVAPPDVQDPTVPLHGYFKDYPQTWLNMHRGFVAEAKKGTARVVFLGDSITQGWGNEGKAEWDKRFAPLGAVNFGIGGDRTQQLLWRIEHGTLDGLSPQLVVLKIGVNNLWRDVAQYKPAGVAAGVKKVVEAIRSKCPGAKVLVLGILPTQNPATNSLRTVIREINSLSAKLDDGKTVRFLDIGPAFLQPDGSIDKAVMPDLLHLSPEGYRRFADAIEPVIRGILGAEKSAVGSS
jgi:lysophospholipase L1-like esterase